MLIERSSRYTALYVANRTVAIVGNSPVLLRQSYGFEIDDHDIVLRVNGAVPPSSASHGTRTDVLCCSIIDPMDEVLPAMSPEWLWWFKITRAGLDGRERACRWYDENGREAELFCWKDSSERILARDVGAPPSTGLRALWLLATGWQPAKIDTYGLTFWGMDSPGENQGVETSLFTNKPPHEAHSPAKEWAFFQTLNFRQLAPGRWTR